MGFPDYNFVYMNDGNHSNINLSLLEAVFHEIGHNMAAENQHADGKFQYDERGIQSNESDKLDLTPENSRTIINDKTNRSTIDK